MLISTVITHSDWVRIEEVWTTAIRRFELEQDWEILQITDEGDIRKFALRANKHGDHETLEIMVELRIREHPEIQPGNQVTWDASKRCIELPSCRTKYIEECNSRSSGTNRFTPDEPFRMGVGM